VRIGLCREEDQYHCVEREWQGDVTADTHVL